MKRLIKKVVSITLSSLMLFGAGNVYGQNNVQYSDHTIKLTVGKGGEYDYHTVGDAVSAIKTIPTAKNPAIIDIADGVYEETIDINKPYIKLIHSGKPENAVITYDKSTNHSDPKKNFGTDMTFTVQVNKEAVGFEAENITFQNSYNIGTNNKQVQAVAFENNADKVVINNCRFIGRQDTLYLKGASKGQQVYGSADNARIYIANSYIEGTVDFIFGDGTAFFDNCDLNMIYREGGGHFTAPNTTLYNVGYVFNKCRITVAEGFNASNANTADLGRPWQCDSDYPNSGSNSVFINCTLPKYMDNEGFKVWDESTIKNKMRFYEYGSVGTDGKPLDLSGRADFVKVLTAQQAELYNAYNILGGNDGWNPALVGGKRGDCDLTLDSYDISIPMNESYSLKALALPSLTNNGVSFTSSDSSVASVDEKGVIKGIKEGKAVITASLSNGLRTSSEVKVTAMRTLVPKITSLSMGGDSNIVVGKTLTADYKFELESDKAIDESVITWYAVKDNNAIIIKSGIGDYFKSYEVTSKDAGYNIRVDVQPATVTTYETKGEPVSYTSRSIVADPDADTQLLLRTNFSNGTEGFDVQGNWSKKTVDGLPVLAADCEKSESFMAYAGGYGWSNIDMNGRFRFNPNKKGLGSNGSYDFYTNYAEDGNSYYRINLARGGNYKSLKAYIYKKAAGSDEVLLASDENSLKNNIYQNSGENNPYFNVGIKSLEGKITFTLTLEGSKKPLCTLEAEDSSALENGTFAMKGSKLDSSILINTIAVESAVDSLNNNSKQRIFLLGDSTVKHYGDDNTIGGWGEYLVNYFDKNVTIINKAEGGRSTRSFINQGRLAEVVKEIKPGDYVFIQFGTNDQRTDKDAFLQHSVALGTPNEEGIYPSTQAIKSETPKWLYDATQGTEYPYQKTFYPYESGTFKWYLGQYIKEVRQAGATPVLLTPACRIFFDSDGKIVSHFGENDGYVLSAKQLAEEQGVICIDMFSITKSLYESYGVLTTQGLHNIKSDGSVDITHYNKFGANLVASKLADAIKELNIKGVSEHIKPSVKLVTKTDSLKTANLIMVGGSGMAKAEGDFAVENGGYGDYLGEFISDKITVKNMAVSGESAKSYIKTDNYKSFLDSVNEGDYVMIGFGKDDGDKGSDDDIIAKYSSSEGDLEKKDSFAYYLYNYYIKPVQDKNAVPILLTPYADKTVLENGEANPYTKAITDLVTAKSLFFVNLVAHTNDMYTTMGAEGGKVLNAYDRVTGICNDELSEFGARLVAKKIINSMKFSSASLKDYIDDSKLSEKSMMTRADYVYMVMRVLNYDEEAFNNFADVSQGKYYAEAVGRAKSRKLLESNEKNLFYPEDRLTGELLKNFTEKALDAVGCKEDMSEVYELAKGEISPEIGIWAVDRVYEAINK